MLNPYMHNQNYGRLWTASVVRSAFTVSQLNTFSLVPPLWDWERGEQAFAHARLCQKKKLEAELQIRFSCTSCCLQRLMKCRCRGWLWQFCWCSAAVAAHQPVGRHHALFQVENLWLCMRISQIMVHIYPFIIHAATQFELSTVTVGAISLKGQPPAAKVTWSTTIPPAWVCDICDGGVQNW